MPRIRSRSVFALAVATLLLLAVTGCGSDTETAEVSSVDPAPGTVVDKTAFIGGLLDAVEEQGTAQAELTLGTGITAQVTFRYGAQPAAVLSVELLGRTLRLVVVDELVYLQKSAAEKFVVLTRDDPSLEAFGDGFSDLDPQKVLSGLVDGITEVREIGPATIEGASLTRYAVTVDSEKVGSGMLEMLPGADLAEGLTLDLYVDGNDLLQRVEADLGGNELVLTVTSWGEPVTITAPPPGEILQNQ